MLAGEFLAGDDPRLTARLLRCGVARAPMLLCIHGGGCDGRYFDLPGFSVADLALSKGHDVLLLDRPGHGNSAPARTTDPIVEAAELLPRFLAPIMAERTSDGLAVLGHSIGGALALTLAASGKVPIGAVAVSGIGRVPSEAALSWFDHLRTDGVAPPADFFFGPNGSYDWRSPIALRKITQPWRLDEVRETLFDWPRRFDAVAASLRMPVSIHLAEHERIWQLDEFSTGALSARFSASPRVLAGLLAAGGHLYELHANGARLVETQLAFLARQAPERIVMRQFVIDGPATFS